MEINKVDVEKFRETVEKARKDPTTGKKVVEVEGEWRIGKEGPQFESKIKTEKGGEITLFSDETLILGGGGTAPNPVQYCIYGLIACYAATYAKWAAMKGIELRSFKIKAKANMDLTRAFGVTQNPILEKLQWTMEINSDADIGVLAELCELAKARCPGYYCVTHVIYPEIEIKKLN